MVCENSDPVITRLQTRSFMQAVISACEEMRKHTRQEEEQEAKKAHQCLWDYSNAQTWVVLRVSTSGNGFAAPPVLTTRLVGQVDSEGTVGSMVSVVESSGAYYR
ncbi:hypothetical protein MTO96_002049 [Rhipicephalus appendiculatus]